MSGRPMPFFCAFVSAALIFAGYVVAALWMCLFAPIGAAWLMGWLP